MGLFDKLKPSERGIDLSKTECYLFLPYYCYLQNGSSGYESSIFLATNRRFLGDSEIDFDYYIDKFESIIEINDIESLISFSVNNISKEDRVPMFIYLMEGIMADSYIDEDEIAKIHIVSQKMNIDSDFEDKVIEVFKQKYSIL